MGRVTVRVRGGAAAVALGVALSLLPVFGGSAQGPAGAATVRSASKGANPNSRLCKAIKDQSASSTKLTRSIESALEGGNWATAKKELLGAIASDGKQLALARSLESSFPSKVKAAFNVLLGFATKVEGAIKKATSMTAFETSMEKLSQTAKLQSASQTVESYSEQQCGTLATPTT